MGAGEHDGVGAPAVPLDEAWRDLAGDVGIVDRFFVQRGLRDRWELPGADQGHSQPWPKSRIRARVYSRLTVASVPSTDTSLDLDAPQAGLMAGTVPTKGTAKRARKCGNTRVDAVLQAITTMSGAWPRSAPPSAARPARPASPRHGAHRERTHRRRHRHIRIRPRLYHFAEHGEAAEAGVEHEDGRGCHGAVRSARSVEDEIETAASIENSRDDDVLIDFTRVKAIVRRRLNSRGDVKPDLEN